MTSIDLGTQTLSESDMTETGRLIPNSILTIYISILEQWVNNDVIWRHKVN